MNTAKRNVRTAYTTIRTCIWVALVIGTVTLIASALVRPQPVLVTSIDPP